MILLIDTSQETGTVALSKDGQVLFSEQNKKAKEHASWLHAAIGRMLTAAGKSLRDLEAVAVVAGPGSYTGLRVAMAAAKGFCFALKIPLITQNTLRVMAESMRAAAEESGALICPMIDARREEVFTALYRLDPATGQRSSVIGQPSPVIGQPSAVTGHPSSVIGHRSSVIAHRSPAIDTPPRPLQELLPPHALILDKNVFDQQLSGNSIIFFGSGAAKWEKYSLPPQALFLPQKAIIQSFVQLAQADFTAGIHADPIYSEPVYLKEFFSY